MDRFACKDATDAVINTLSAEELSVPVNTMPQLDMLRTFESPVLQDVALVAIGHSA